MKLIIGLGNPGEEYSKTRHNIGFMFIDFLKKKYDFGDFKYESKFKGEISEGKINGEKYILLKPSTYMNLSGESVNNIVNYYKIDKDKLVIIYDDISMDFGKIRFRQEGSPGGHNGIKNIQKYVGQKFKRIKIGVGHDKKYDVTNWVLSRFSEKELIDIDSIILNNGYLVLEENFISNR